MSQRFVACSILPRFGSVIVYCAGVSVCMCVHVYAPMCSTYLGGVVSFSKASGEVSKRCFPLIFRGGGNFHYPLLRVYENHYWVGIDCLLA